MASCLEKSSWLLASNRFEVSGVRFLWWVMVGCVLLDGWVKSLLVVFAIWAGVLSNDLFYIWRVQRWWRISCLFVFFFKMSGIESLRVSQRGSHLDTVDTFTPGLRLSLPTMIHCIEAGIEKYLPLYQWNGWNGSLTGSLFWYFFWGVLIGGSKLLRASVSANTSWKCSGSDGAFMKNMRHDLDGSMRPPNPREESSGETTLTLWKVQ